MRVIKSNCTVEDSNICTYDELNYSFGYRELSIIQITLDSLGIISNIVALLVLGHIKKRNRRFFQFLKIDTLTTLVSNINSLVLSLMFLVFVDNIYHLSNTSFVFFSRVEYINYFTYVYKMVWAIFYTMSTCFDILLVYEKIQIYKRNTTFITKRSAILISSYIFLYSVILNGPINMTRDVMKKEFNTSDESFSIYSYGKRSLPKNLDSILLGITIIFNIMREFGHLIMIIAINITLIIVIKSHNKKKIKINTHNKELVRQNYLNDCKIVSIKSTYNGLLICSVFFFNVDKLLGYDYLRSILFQYVTSIVHSLRSTINLLLLLKYNKKFRQNFFSNFRSEQ